jgi:hypothetical protein
MVISFKWEMTMCELETNCQRARWPDTKLMLTMLSCGWQVVPLKIRPWGTVSNGCNFLQITENSHSKTNFYKKLAGPAGAAQLL